MKKVTITYVNGKTTVITVPNDAAARRYENLPFEDRRVVSVTVTDS